MFNHLTKIRQRTRIERQDDGAACTEDEGKTWISIPNGATVTVEDRENVIHALQNFKDQGLYPQTLWGHKR